MAGGDLHKTTQAGRDIVGRDVVTNTSNVNVGFGIQAVQRLVLTVGLLVFVTAGCFFSGGVAVGGVAIAALSREVGSNPQASSQFESGLQQLQSLPSGTPFTFSFTEEQISSYFRLEVAPNQAALGISDARVRLLESGGLVIGGRADRLGGAQFAANFQWTTTPGRPLRLTGAALQVLPLGRAAFGWVVVPAFLLRGAETGINDMFNNVTFTDVTTSANGQVWRVSGLAR